MGKRLNARTASEQGTDLSVLTAVEIISSDDSESAQSPIQEQYRALVAAHMEALAQLSDLQLDYSRLLNAATRAHQELERLREEVRVLENERHLIWRKSIQEAREARDYAASLEARLDRVNRSLVQRVIHRITGQFA
jgi:chromosome segregation ATPase